MANPIKTTDDDGAMIAKTWFGKAWFAKTWELLAMRHQMRGLLQQPAGSAGVWIAAVLLMMVLGSADGHAQGQPVTPPNGAQPNGWQTGTQVDPQASPKQPGFGNTTVVPRAASEEKPKPPPGRISVSAVLSEDGAPIEEGIVWRAFQTEKPLPGAEPAKPRLVGAWREASPTLQLPAGDYLVNAAFGRAQLTRRLTVAAGAQMKEQFVLNAGGLRIQAVLAGGEALPANAIGYDIYAADSDQQGARAKLVSAGKPGLILRLNAGVYQVVSTYGDANSVVRADVTVDAGKLSEATIMHHAAKVTLKLVTRPGGEAIALWELDQPVTDDVLNKIASLPQVVRVTRLVF